MSISESQIPKWLTTENERVHIVWDWEIVPREYLPVFNSNVIDLYIPRIEGLSERYLYACDDYIVMRGQKADDYFTEEGIKLHLGQYWFTDSTYFQTVFSSDWLICPHLVSKTSGRYILPYCHHAIVPHLKSENLEVLEKFQEDIEKSLSRFREGKNLTWLIYPLCLMQKGLLQEANVVTNFNPLIDENSIRNLNFRDCDVIVLNDEFCGDFEKAKAMLINRLEEVLSGKSEFEK